MAQVNTNDFAKFRREIRKADKTVAGELQADLKDIAQGVAREASGLADRKSGKMAAGYRGAAAGAKGVVRNRVFYSRFIEFGFHPGGSDTFVPGRNPIGQAIERREDDIVDSLGDAVERAARRMGWQ
jgi:hypothetical protein